jgi:hypothetical protein
LNKTKLKQTAKLLDTFPEVLTADTELTKDELIMMDKFLHILKDPNHGRHKMLLNLLATSANKSTN